MRNKIGKIYKPGSFFQKNRKKFCWGALALVVAGLFFFAGYRVGLREEVAKEPPDEIIREQKTELDRIRRDRGYVPPTEEEAQAQIQELRSLREEARNQEEEE